VTEEVNRKCPPRNMIFQLATHYTHPEPSKSRRPAPKISTSGIAMLRMLTMAIEDNRIAIPYVVYSK